MKKRVATDIALSILALACMHGVLQLAVYPYLSKRLGAERFGDALYVLAIIGVLAPSAGMPSNSTRLLNQRDGETQNGDYLLPICLYLLPSLVLLHVICADYFRGFAAALLAAAVLVLTALRFYGDVTYRLALNYRGYLVYYVVLSIGYLAGILLYPITKSWLLCFLLGELSCFILLEVKEHLYHPLTLTPKRWGVVRQTAALAGSNLLGNALVYMDRLMLQNLMDGRTVTVYYVASLLGKTLAMLVGPLNNIIISYLTKLNKRITRRTFILAFLTALGASAVFFAGIMIVGPIFTRLLYLEVYEDVLKILWAATLSQLLYFAATPLMTVLLTFSSVRWQFVIQLIHAAAFIVASYFGVCAAGLVGFVFGGMAANLLRLLLVVWIGIAKAKRDAANDGEREQK